MKQHGPKIMEGPSPPRGPGRTLPLALGHLGHARAAARAHLIPHHVARLHRHQTQVPLERVQGRLRQQLGRGPPQLRAAQHQVLLPVQAVEAAHEDTAVNEGHAEEAAEEAVGALARLDAVHQAFDHLLLAYGAVSFASEAGPLSGNHFLTLTEGLDNIYALGRKTLLEGQQDIRFELV